jgi:hypothetical protein
MFVPLRRTGVSLGSLSLLFTLACGCGGGDAASWDGSQWRMAVRPADGAIGVARRQRIEVDLEQLPLRNTVTDATVRVSAGVIRPPVQLTLRALPRMLWITPVVPFDADVKFQLEISGIVDLDGDSPPQPFRSTFSTGQALGDWAAPLEVDAGAVVDLIAARCGGASCHAGDEPALGLDLSSAGGIEATAKNHIASQAYVGTESGPGSTGVLFAATPLIIQANDMSGEPARSYLMLKILADAHIVGAAMPPPSAKPLTQVEIQRIADWIQVGAPTP